MRCHTKQQVSRHSTRKMQSTPSFHTMHRPGLLLDSGTQCPRARTITAAGHSSLRAGGCDCGGSSWHLRRLKMCSEDPQGSWRRQTELQSFRPRRAGMETSSGLHALRGIFLGSKVDRKADIISSSNFYIIKTMHIFFFFNTKFHTKIPMHKVMSE